MGPALFTRENARPRRHTWDVDHSGFNGARVVHAGKLWHCIRLAEMGDMASMGPALFTRENSTSRTATAKRWKASMGPALFTRENRERGSSRGGIAQASMGPALFTRENRLLQLITYPSDRIASMGPALFTREN